MSHVTTEVTTKLGNELKNVAWNPFKVYKLHTENTTHPTILQKYAHISIAVQCQLNFVVINNWSVLITPSCYCSSYNSRSYYRASEFKEPAARRQGVPKFLGHPHWCFWAWGAQARWRGLTGTGGCLALWETHVHSRLLINSPFPCHHTLQGRTTSLHNSHEYKQQQKNCIWYVIRYHTIAFSTKLRLEGWL